MADIISDLYNTACKMLGINQPVNSASGCQQEIMRKAQMQGMQQNSMNVPFNADKATVVSRHIMGPAQGSMQMDTSFKFNTDSNTVIKRSQNLPEGYMHRQSNGIFFN